MILSDKYSCDTICLKFLDLYTIWFILTGDHPGLKLFNDRMATYEQKGKSISLKLFLIFIFSVFDLCIFLLFILTFYNNLLTLVCRRDAKSMLSNNFCKLFQLRTIWYRIELLPYFVVLTLGLFRSLFSLPLVRYLSGRDGIFKTCRTATGEARLRMS